MCRFNRLINHSIIVHRGYKTSFVSRWRHVHTVVQHRMIKLLKSVDIAPRNLAKARNISFLTKKNAEHTTDLISRHRDTSRSLLLRWRLQHEPAAHLFV